MFRKQEHARCQNGENCVGPGCRAQTGKTKRDREKHGEKRESK